MLQNDLRFPSVWGYANSVEYKHRIVLSRGTYLTLFLVIWMNNLDTLLACTELGKIINTQHVFYKKKYQNLY